MTLETYLVAFLGMTAIIAVRYLAISGLFYWLLWGRDPAKVHAIRLTETQPKSRIVRREIYWSLLSSFIYAAPAAWVLEVWLKEGGSAIYMDVDAYPLWWIPVSIGVYLFLHDTYFYWTHRLMHHRKIFPIMHRVHHDSRPPTPWASFSFHPWESVLGAVFIPAMAMLVPIHIGALLFILMLMTICAVLNHSGWEIFPKGWLRGLPGRNFITAAHHDLHHKHFSCNYGLYFRWWDKWMGTDIMESEYDFLGKSAGDKAASTA